MLSSVVTTNLITSFQRTGLEEYHRAEVAYAERVMPVVCNSESADGGVSLSRSVAVRSSSPVMNAKVEASRTSGGRVPSLQEVAQSMMNATADKDSFIEKEY